MKQFKCGNCQTLYKIDETKVTGTQALLQCGKCGVKNLIKFGLRVKIETKQNDDSYLLKTYNLKDGNNIVGRKTTTNEVDISIDDEYVSRKHISINIEKKEEKIFISLEDLGSSNGTLNDKKIKLNSGVKYPFLKGQTYIIGNSKISLIL